jgi:hypothetical protein
MSHDEERAYLLSTIEQALAMISSVDEEEENLEGNLQYY